jgi:hypothetical protein
MESTGRAAARLKSTSAARLRPCGHWSILLALASQISHGQQAVVSNASLERSPMSWAQAAARNQADIVQSSAMWSLRFRQRKVDAKGDTTREIIESQQGGVARLVERGGKPITATEDAAERDRLQASLASPDEFLRHHRHDKESRQYALDLIQQMPSAMIYSYAPDQPQPSGATSRQIVLDFQPDPKYHPPMMIADLLTGLAGRLWIDAASERVTRAECHVVKPVNIGWGMVGRIYPGGTMEFGQTDAGGGRWVYSRLEEHVTVRELMVKMVPVNVVMTSSEFRVLPSLLSYQDAIHMLLAEKIPLR